MFPHPNFIAGYVVQYHHSKEPLYLLLQRSQRSYFPGLWQIVTGKLNPDETATAAVKREIAEETGLACSELYNVDVTMFYEQPKNRMAFSANFCAFVKGPIAVVLSPTEHDAYQWCNFLEASSLLAFPAQKQTLAFIHHFYVLQKPHAVNLVC
jgi:dATP pyrophosphohydrolase